MEIEGAVSVVTGAASGIGRATALALATAGSDVVVADIDGNGAEHVAAEIELNERRALAVRTDVAKRNEVEHLVERAITWQGHCDIFISNAGVGCTGAPQDFTHDEWEYLIGVNLMSCVWPLRRVIPHMLERGSGHLAFVSSGAGIEGIPDRAPYNVAKFGVVGLAESLARYLNGTGVGVSLIVPGAVATNGWKLYVMAGASDVDQDEIARVRTSFRDATSSWPKPEVMAGLIVDGLREDRFAILQDNPYQPDWYAETLERKARDPEGFVRR